MPTDDRSFDVVEQRIRRAIEEGEFDDLPGAGRPISDLDREYDPGWWAKRYLERMKAEDALLDLGRTLDREIPLLRTMDDRAAAEKRVAEVNELIEELNARVAPDHRIAPVSLDL